MASLRELAERAAELRLSALRRVSRSVFRSERAAGLRRLLLRGRATAVAEGLDPDSPSMNGVINRVVNSFTIHGVPAQ